MRTMAATSALGRHALPGAHHERRMSDAARTSQNKLASTASEEARCGSSSTTSVTANATTITSVEAPTVTIGHVRSVPPESTASSDMVTCT
jgi:hypothetical protein